MAYLCMYYFSKTQMSIIYLCLNKLSIYIYRIEGFTFMELIKTFIDTIKISK